MSNPEATKPEKLRFSEVVNSLIALTPTDKTESVEADSSAIIEFPSWNANMKKPFVASSVVAATAGLGDKVRCSVVGDEETGAALIFRSRNLFNTARYGFFIQREPNNEVSVWHGPSKKRESGDWIGAAMLDQDLAQQASPELTNALITDLLSNANQ